LFCLLLNQGLDDIQLLNDLLRLDIGFLLKGLALVIDAGLHLADLVLAVADDLLLDLLLGLLLLLHHEEDGFLHVGELLGLALREDLGGVRGLVSRKTTSLEFLSLSI